MNNRLYKLMNWPLIEEIIYSESSHPHDLLGPHVVGNQTLFQTFFPGAVSINLNLYEAKIVKKMEMADEEGYFAVLVSGKKLGKYYYEVTYRNGHVLQKYDPYMFPPMLTKKDMSDFDLGIHYTIYKVLGAHPKMVKGIKGTFFAVWAPNAIRVSVVGDFNQWDGRVHPMSKDEDSGVFELFIPNALEGANYKYELKLKGGLTYLKADPYANATQLRPENASVIADIEHFNWEDDNWIQNRSQVNCDKMPISIYEMYLGSFITKEGNFDDGSCYVNYKEIAQELIPYMKKTGYTHVEVMPVMEHPLDASWGYQTLGYYAPTARYGSPEDFMWFINELHKAELGVILDWVPAHFPKDDYGLSNFDGTCLYEHQDPRKGCHPHWGTLIYNYGRPQVSNFLIANALFWVEKYHADGIRMDAVASMLYLDYGKQDREWIPNIYGGNENLEAVEFIKHLNSIIHKRNPGIITIAEESTAWPMVTGDLNSGGLGFDMKWNMGWMNDFLDYMHYDPYFRSHHHNELTFSMIYAYSENFVLVLSHDEVVHGKSSLLGKMPGNREQKFANLRLAYSFMMMHPGKKLLFMGQDFAEFDEWNERREIKWGLLKDSEHRGIHELVKALNHLYCGQRALHSNDTNPDGFEWINCIDSQKCYLSFLRKGDKKEDTLLVLANFSGVDLSLSVGVPYDGIYKEIFHSDDRRFGGKKAPSGRRQKKSTKGKCDERAYYIKVDLSPLSLIVYSYNSFDKIENNN